MRVTYEITATVRSDLCADYERFMIDRHIPDLLRTRMFEQASISRDDAFRYRVRYEARDRESLDQYLTGYADRLRRDFASVFPEGIDISREEWSEIARFP